MIHGGYYLVTDGLREKYGHRIMDIPPDETGLIGLAIGYSQAGLVTICEIPYAKYLDCGMDMFFESILMNWLSHGKQPNGLLIRLQGFGNGTFGGNMHTHNMIHHAPGLDIVCNSNGADYIRSHRFLMNQVQNGRVCMSIDCTKILTLRHIHDDLREGDCMQICPGTDEWIGFDDIIVYPSDFNNLEGGDKKYFDKKMIISSEIELNGKISEDARFVNLDELKMNEIVKNDKKRDLTVIISYGLGVVISRQA